MLSIIIQNEDLKSFLALANTSSGKGTSSMTHDRVNRITQICAAKDYTAKFCNKKVRQEAQDDNNYPLVLCLAVMHGTVYRNIHLDLGKQLQEAELILAQEDSDVPMDSSPLCGKEPP